MKIFGVMLFAFLTTPVFADEIFLRCVEEGSQTYELNLDREGSRASVTRIQDNGSGIVVSLDMRTTSREYLLLHSSTVGSTTIETQIALDRKTLIMVETMKMLMPNNLYNTFATRIKQCSLIEVEDNKI